MEEPYVLLSSPEYMKIKYKNYKKLKNHEN